MNQRTYAVVEEAARSLDRSDSRGTWTLAYAILAHIPADYSTAAGGAAPHSDPPRGGSVPKQLAALAAAMDKAGVTAPNGAPYSPSSLKNLREMAMGWTKSERHDEAAYRTHQEAGGREALGRKVLTALCAIARGEQVRRPLDVEAEAWGEAVKRVRARKRGSGYAVNANDVRIALERRPNLPGRSMTVEDISGANPQDIAAAVAASPEAAAAVAENPEARHAVMEAIIDDSHDIEPFDRDLDRLTDFHVAVRGLHGYIVQLSDLVSKESVPNEDVARLKREDELLHVVIDLAQGLKDISTVAELFGG